MPPRRLEDVFKICLQDVFSITIFRIPGRLARGLENVFKTSSRRLRRRKNVTRKTCSRRVQDVFKTNKCLLGSYFSVCENVAIYHYIKGEFPPLWQVFQFSLFFHLFQCLSQYMFGHNFTMKFPPDFHNYTGLNRLANSFS